MIHTHLTWSDGDAASDVAVPPSSMQAIRHDAVRGSARTSQRWLRRALDLLSSWQERARGRYQLTHVDDHLLRDIGKTRTDIALEIQRPFWRA